jgi:hypothetical protein
MFERLIEITRSDLFKNTLRVIGAYGIIVVFAQDIGVRTGCKQALLGQNLFIQMIVFTSVAFSVSDDLAQSFTGTLVYFLLKYYFSKGVTNDVCFPSECEIRKCAATTTQKKTALINQSNELYDKQSGLEGSGVQESSAQTSGSSALPGYGT